MKTTVFVLLISFALMFVSVYNNVYIAYPLSVILLIFIALVFARGGNAQDIRTAFKNGALTSFVVFQILILIGMLTAAWMSSGTVAAIVYYGIQLIDPSYFVIEVFLITCVVSFLIGSSFGTAGTIGVAFMVMAQAAGVDPSLTAGAVISGAYFGDRSSPMSSSAALVATLTGTDINANIRNMMKTVMIPFAASGLLYLFFSWGNPASISDTSLESDLLKTFTINLQVLIPAAMIFIAVFFKVKVKKAIAASLIVSFFIAMIFQQRSFVEFIQSLIFGFFLESENPLYSIIRGGGIVSMLKILLVILISSTLASIIEYLNILERLLGHLKRIRGTRNVFAASIAVSIFSSAVGCSQVVAVMMTYIAAKGMYKENGLSDQQLALDLENTAIVIAPLIPWNIAVLGPLVILSASSASILYAFFLFSVPLCSLIFRKSVQ